MGNCISQMGNCINHLRPARSQAQLPNAPPTAAPVLEQGPRISASRPSISRSSLADPRPSISRSRRSFAEPSTSGSRRFSPPPLQIMSNLAIRQYTPNQIRNATNNFDGNLRVGSGSFGEIYRVNMGSEGQAAIKCTCTVEGQKALVNEAKILQGLQHDNIIRLMEHCHDDRKYYLVYEFVDNNTLNHWLYENPSPLSWASRVKIVRGIADGLLFLRSQNPPIMHFDLNPNNILLDWDYNPKITDFDTAVFGPEENYTDRLLELNQLIGTVGYRDPMLSQRGVRLWSMTFTAMGLFSLR